MTPLQKHIVKRIEATGPLTVADYMAEALMHPRFGYYASRDPFGQNGDFTTAPEITQMFGELIGAAMAQCWMDQGSPKRFALVELGPGRGTLMQDLLRATRDVPGFHAAAQIHLVETSDRLRGIQAEALSQYKVRWLESANDLPELPCFAVANEFFDALPIRQFQRMGRGWREYLVGSRYGDLFFGLTEPVPLQALAYRLEDTKNEDVVEICPAASNVIDELGRRIATLGGAALIVDYGDWRSLGDTLQALRRHERVDPLDSPGRADLTAHVDFEALVRAGSDIEGLTFSPLIPQGVFLERLGITQRALLLAERLDGQDLTSHIAAHRRLTHPEEMGSLFKCLAMMPLKAAPFPGLTA